MSCPTLAVDVGVGRAPLAALLLDAVLDVCVFLLTAQNALWLRAQRRLGGRGVRGGAVQLLTQEVRFLPLQGAHRLPGATVTHQDTPTTLPGHLDLHSGCGGDERFDMNMTILSITNLLP